MTAHAPSILLLDPYEDNRDMYAKCLDLAGFAPRLADSSDAALLMAPAADVIVTSIWVPGSFDGLELVRRVRLDDAAKPVIVLTALDTYRDAAVAAGCSVFLTKPCVPSVLVEQIHQMLAALRAARTHAQAGRDKTRVAVTRSKRIVTAGLNHAGRRRVVNPLPGSQG